MLKDFKEFAMRGNVIDMAVGIIIGAAIYRFIGGTELIKPEFHGGAGSLRRHR